jgi:hypothetical protein
MFYGEKKKNIQIIILKILQAKVNESHLLTGADADLVIYLTFSNEGSQSPISFSAACFLSGYNNRPIAGQLNIDLGYIDFSKESFQKHVSQIIHEVKHNIKNTS